MNKQIHRDGDSPWAKARGEDAKAEDWKIKNAECSFVHKDYHQALHLANEVLQESSPTTSMERVESLQTPVFSVGCKLSLSLDNTIQVTDRAGAIALQCIHATSVDDSEVMLEPFLEFYSTSPMSLDLLVIVIQFLLHTGKQHNAIELASETLYYIQHSSATKNGTASSKIRSHLQESTDDLVWTLVTKLIPYCQNERYVNYLSGDDSHHWQASIEKSSKWHKEPYPSILFTLTNALDSLQGVASKDCLERCCTRLGDLGGIPTTSSTATVPKVASCGIARPPRQSSPRWLDALVPSTRNDWYQTIAVRVLNVMTERIIRPVLQSGDRERRSQMAVTILALVVAWKQRHRLRHATISLGRMVLKPLAEIMDAVLPLEQ